MNVITRSALALAHLSEEFVSSMGKIEINPLKPETVEDADTKLNLHLIIPKRTPIVCQN